MNVYQKMTLKLQSQTNEVIFPNRTIYTDEINSKLYELLETIDENAQETPMIIFEGLLIKLIKNKNNEWIYRINN